jgi:uncharacterized membrane protein
MPKSSTGMDENVAALLSYVLWWVTGIIFFVIEKNSKFVKFHAMQSIIFFGAVTVVVIVLGILAFIPYIGFIFGIIAWLIDIFAFIMWIILMVKAYQHQMFKLPVAGPMAEKYAK